MNNNKAEIKKIDRRIKICFQTLEEQQEILISSDLIDYMIWYNKYKDKVDAIIINSGKEVNNDSIVEFWINNIGKSSQVEEYLNDLIVIADTYDFVNNYFDTFIKLKKEPEYQVFGKEAYRTEDMANQLTEIFEKYPNNYKVKQIRKFLSRNRMDADHITTDFAAKTINTCLKYI